jgi:trimethylamine--corrinoid protein Co-methyltransferase
MKILTSDEVRQIHEASLRILKNTGMKIEHERMLKMLADYGADVDFSTMTAKFPPALVEECIKRQVSKANGGDYPASDYFDVSGGVRSHAAKMSLTTHIFCVNINDDDSGDIRPATLSDLECATLIANELENVSGIGPLVVPNDVPVEMNDAYMWAITLKRAKKRISGEILNQGCIPYIYDMCCAAAGGEKEMLADPLMSFPCFPSSPLAYSRYALDMAFEFVDRRLPVRLGSSMVVAGFTGPVTLAGALTVATAETLGSMVMAESISGGVFAGLGFSISFNQANGTALYASPEKFLMSFAVRDIAKYYGFAGWNYFGGHTNGSDACFPGIQAGIEKGLGMMFTAMQGGGGGMCGMVSPEVASLAQMVIDDEICDFANRMNEGIKVDGDTIAAGLIEELGIHGNYIDMASESALEHLTSHFRSEHWLPKLFVRERPQQWQASKRDTLMLAKEKVRKLLKDNDPHPLGSEKEREIDKILEACRKYCGK